MRRRVALAVAAAAVALLAVVAALAWALGLARAERHVGFFAPVWDSAGRQVYFLERESWGFVWGAGWEHFTPPAWTYVAGDRLSLQRLDPATRRVERLEVFEESPLRGRITRHYRGRILGGLSAHISPDRAGVDFLARMNVPRVPTSEHWTLRGRWSQGSPSLARWAAEWSGGSAGSEAVLVGGVELLVLPGEESFPCAIVAVEASGAVRVLRASDAFDALYPDGVSAAHVAERSRRAQIESARELRRLSEEFVASYRARGASDGEARLRAHRTLEDRGYYPKSPRLVARSAAEPPPGVPIFEIPGAYLEVGLFQDVAAAIAEPGKEVETSTGTYLQYYDDRTGPRLRAWREAGNDRFAVHSEGRLYVLEVRRFDP